ncbi:metallophosphoesterase [Candidatus Pacearchaeota archaeon]|nr:metallophosphoesterase [Candidatus Pacearchaeota archaeon]
MKLLIFTDTHGSSIALRRIEHKVISETPDILVCAGDISIFEHGIGSIFRRLNKMHKKIIIVHGNHEDAATYLKYSKILKNIIFIHKKHHIEGNLLFLGYGGGGFAKNDREFEHLAKTRFNDAIKNNKDKRIILITHGPPYRTRVDKLGRNYAGNKSFRNFIEKHKIDLHVCGHLHENFGKEDKIKNMRIINPGPYGKIVEV